MDLLTQGLLGAAVAQSAAPAKESRIAAFVGAAAGLLPDVDVLITSASDPLLFLEFHRHFTHALVSVPGIALVAAGLIWPLLRKRMRFARVYFYALLGCAMAGLLDACTSYGTHLLWPFSAQPVALSIVSIIDPVVTLALLIGATLTLRSTRVRPARLALVVVGMYLAAGALQHQRAETAAREIAQQRGHVPQRLLVKPTIANIILWRSLYLTDSHLHADGIWLSPLGGRRIYPGETAKRFDSMAPLPAGDPAESIATVLSRFARFAQDLTVRHPTRPEMIGDARFAMLPTSLRPLWGIAPAEPDAGYPAKFVTDRSLSIHDRQRFLDMLLGR